MAALKLGSLPDAIKDKVLECGICKGILCEPRSLKCGHNFCLHCVENDIKVRPRNRKNYACPLCRKGMALPPGGIGEVGCNIVIKNLLDVMDHHDAMDMCTVCNSDCPQWVCISCKVKRLCNPCVKDHKVHVKDHQVVRVADFQKGLYDEKIRQQQTSNCEVHGQKMRYYCKECQKLICVDCCTLGTCTHVESRCSIDEAGKLSGEKIWKALEEVENKLRLIQSYEMQVSESGDRSNNSLLREQKAIQEACQRAVRPVIQRFTHQLSSMHSKHEESRTAVTKELQIKMSAVQETKKKIEKLRKYATCEEKIVSEKDLLQEVAEIGEICPVKVTEPFIPRFIPEYLKDDDIAEVARLVGKINVEASKCVLEIDTFFTGEVGDTEDISSLIVLPNNDIVCIDSINDTNSMKRYSSEGKFEGFFQDMKMDAPMSCTPLPDGSVMVLCKPQKNHPISDNMITFTADGKATGSWRLNGVTGDQHIRQMVRTSTGDIVTLDQPQKLTDVASLRVFSSTGCLKRQLSKDKRGNPYRPFSFTVNSKDQIIFTSRGFSSVFISDPAFKRVQKCFSLEANHVRLALADVCVDKDDFIYVVDNLHNRIICLSPDGKFHRDVLSAELIESPMAIAFDNQGRLVVSAPSRIKVFEISR